MDYSWGLKITNEKLGLDQASTWQIVVSRDTRLVRAGDARHISGPMVALLMQIYNSLASLCTGHRANTTGWR